MWEARSEVDTVIAKVDISAKAYADRTSQRRLDAQMGSRMALRHKPPGVLAVLGPYNFPAHLPKGHIVPAPVPGKADVFRPAEKTARTSVVYGKDGYVRVSLERPRIRNKKIRKKK